jgi:hypothetical protein
MVSGDQLQRYVKGAGAVTATGDALRLCLEGACSGRYSDAQLDDYSSLPRKRFPWSPPVRLEARARFSHPAGRLCGTAGFGFWNDPFGMSGGRLPSLPRAIWFFYASRHSDLRLDFGSPGNGWKAATIDALRPIAGLLAPAAPAAMALMRVRRIYRAFWPKIQTAIGVREAAIDVNMREWHTYSLEWGRATSTFLVDGEVVLRDAPSPRGPLGFVMWLDNQYMVATPWGRFRWGLLGIPAHQWLEVAALALSSL